MARILWIILLINYINKTLNVSVGNMLIEIITYNSIDWTMLGGATMPNKHKFFGNPRQQIQIRVPNAGWKLYCIFSGYIKMGNQNFITKTENWKTSGRNSHWDHGEQNYDGVSTRKIGYTSNHYDYTFIHTKINENNVFCFVNDEKNQVIRQMAYQGEEIELKLHQYIFFSEPVKIELLTPLTKGTFTDHPNPTTVPFFPEDLLYKGTTHGKEVIEYKIVHGSVDLKCSFVVDVCYEICQSCVPECEKDQIEGCVTANETYHGCTQCIFEFGMRYEEGARFFNCYDTIKGDLEYYYYDLDDIAFYKCNSPCLHCSKETHQDNGGCTVCIPDHFFSKILMIA